MKYSIWFKLIGFSVLTGATFSVAKSSLQVFSPASAAAWRFGLAALAMLGLLAWKERMNLPALKANLAVYVALGIVGVAGFNSMFFLGMGSTSPVNGALIMATNPAVTAILAAIFLREPLSGSRLAGIAVSFAGVSLVITGGAWSSLSGFHLAAGDLWMMLGNLCWSAYGILGRKFVKPGTGSTSLSMTTYSMAAGAIGLAVLAVFQPGAVDLQEVPLSAWGGIVFMALGTSVLGYLWWNQGVAAIGAGRTAIFFNLVPVVAMAISAAMGWDITGPQWIGTGLVLAGVLISSGTVALSWKRAPATARN